MNKILKKRFWEIMDWGLSPAVQSIFHKIQTKQSNNNNIPYQFPEPWNGDLENAPLIFVGLNPSFNPDEVFPHDDSNEVNPWWTISPNSNSSGYKSINGIYLNQQHIEDFFENRFSSKYQSGDLYVKNLKVLQQDGKYSKKVRYLSFLEKVMQYELDPTTNPEMGKHCALLEIVPCKSQKCAGLYDKLNNGEPILNDFVDLFKDLLKDIIGNFGKKTFIVLGKDSSSAFFEIIRDLDHNFASQCKDFNSLWKNDLFKTFTASINGKRIDVVFSYHSSHRGFGFNEYQNKRNQYTGKSVPTSKHHP